MGTFSLTIEKMEKPLGKGAVIGEVLNFDGTLHGEKGEQYYFLNIRLCKGEGQNEKFFDYLDSLNDYLDSLKSDSYKKFKVISEYQKASYFCKVNCIVLEGTEAFTKKNFLENNKTIKTYVTLIDNGGDPKIETNGSRRFVVLNFQPLGKLGYFSKQKKETKAKLKKEGLLKRDIDNLEENNFFDPNKILKRQVALVTSFYDFAQAYQDVEKELAKVGIKPDKSFEVRWGHQGDVVEYLISELHRADDSQKFDFIILCRGGGNFHDFIIFDDERLARCLSELKTPVITGIGHANDVSLADLAATYCASTPSAAAIRLRNLYAIQTLLKAGKIDENTFHQLTS